MCWIYPSRMSCDVLDLSFEDVLRCAGSILRGCPAMCWIYPSRMSCDVLDLSFEDVLTPEHIGPNTSQHILEDRITGALKDLRGETSGLAQGRLFTVRSNRPVQPSGSTVR
jgi:hypothetical protein